MAKKKETHENVPFTETYVHLYHGKIQPVQITVHINYNDRTVSLIQFNSHQPGNLQAKQFIFKGRTLDYMKGWHDILDGAKSAIDDATKKLQDHAKRMADAKEEMLAEHFKAENE